MERWESLYQTEEFEGLPWYSRELDKEHSQELEARGIRSGTFLDIGTGPGTQAAALASLGFSVTATDISVTAAQKAAKLYQKVSFIRDNITKTAVSKKFDFIFDRGCFHPLDSRDYSSYLESVSKLLKPDGLLFLKTFSHKERMEGGPHKFSPEQIRGIFSNKFSVLEIRESEFQGVLKPNPKALFCVLEKK